MSAPVRYAYFIKSIGNTEIHNPTTIIKNAEEAGLLQRRFEETKAEQLKTTQGVEQAKKNWSEDREELRFPELEKPITFKETRSKAHGAIRGLRSRKSDVFPDLHDGLAPNGTAGWIGFRWKQALARENWTEEEWAVFQRELSEWREGGESTEYIKPVEPGSGPKKEKQKCLIWKYALCGVLLVAVSLGFCVLSNSFEKGNSHQVHLNLGLKEYASLKKRHRLNENEEKPHLPEFPDIGSIAKAPVLHFSEMPDIQVSSVLRIPDDLILSAP